MRGDHSQDLQMREMSLLSVKVENARGRGEVRDLQSHTESPGDPSLTSMVLTHQRENQSVREGQ